MRTTTALLTTALFAAGTLARTDLEGCVSSKTIAYGGASLLWYVPGTGEICEFLDCGGGRAPPKTTVPGCDAYKGTATYSPNYLAGYGPNAAPTSSSVVASASSAAASPSVTAAPSLSSAAVSSAASATASSSSATEDDDEDDSEDDEGVDGESASASASASSSASSSSSSHVAGISNMVYSIATTPVNSQHAVATPSTTPAASTPASYTGAAGKVEAAAGVAFGGVVAALAWL